MKPEESYYRIFDALGARSSEDGTHILLKLATDTEPLPIAIPVGILAPLIAQLGQAALEAYAITEPPDERVLEASGSEVFRDGENVDMHLRLTDGVDLPVGMKIREAAELRDRIAECLAGTSALPPGTVKQ